MFDGMTTSIVLPMAATGLISLEPPLPAERNPALVYLASLSTAASRRTMRSALRAIVKLLGESDPIRFPWQSLRYQHVAAVQTLLIEPRPNGERLSPCTIKHRIAALRGVLHQAWLLELMGAEDYYRARDTKRIEGSRLPPGRRIGEEEIGRLFLACEAPGLRNSRDGAVLGLLCAGLRRFEIVDLNIDRFDETLGQITVIGKRNQERCVQLPPGTRSVLRRWMKYRGDEPGPLILPIDQHGRARMKRCCEKVIPGILQSLGKATGVTDFTAHDFRRTLITNLIDRGIDMARIQRIVGHKSVQTTVLYDRREEQQAHEVMNSYNVPVPPEG
jgi:site-specific recombinase XerD